MKKIILSSAFLVVAVIVLSASLLAAQINLSNITTTNAVKTNDAILVNANLGAGVWATRTATKQAVFGDPFKVTSLLSSNATNVALRVNTSQAWSGGNLMALANGDTNVAWFEHSGGLSIGAGSVDAWGAGGGITIFPDTSLSSPTPSPEIVAGYTDGGSEFRYVYISGSTAPFMEINYDGLTGTLLAPAKTTGQRPYVFATTSLHASGVLAAVRNFSTDKLLVNFDGSVTASRVESEPAAPSDGFYTLFAITNGPGKMILKVRFPTGASQTIATEP